jgi:hypothetical protein
MPQPEPKRLVGFCIIANRGNAYVGGGTYVHARGTSIWGNLDILRDRADNPLRFCVLFVVDR